MTAGDAWARFRAVPLVAQLAIGAGVGLVVLALLLVAVNGVGWARDQVGDWLFDRRIAELEQAVAERDAAIAEREATIAEAVERERAAEARYQTALALMEKERTYGANLDEEITVAAEAARAAGYDPATARDPGVGALYERLRKRDARRQRR